MSLRKVPLAKHLFPPSFGSGPKTLGETVPTACLTLGSRGRGGREGAFQASLGHHELLSQNCPMGLNHCNPTLFQKNLPPCSPQLSQQLCCWMELGFSELIARRPPPIRPPEPPPPACPPHTATSHQHS